MILARMNLLLEYSNNLEINKIKRVYFGGNPHLAICLERAFIGFMKFERCSFMVFPFFCLRYHKILY